MDKPNSSPKNVRRLAKGLNPDEGGAHMVHYEIDNDDQVFSTGSITWVSSVLVDNKVPQITANVLERFLS